MKTLFVSRWVPDQTFAALREIYDVTHEDKPLSAAEARHRMADYDAMLCCIGDDLSEDAFEGDPRCGLIANYGVGYNHIAVEAARAKGVAVTNTPGAVTDGTADIALTLILAARRRAGEGERRLRAGDWDGWHPGDLLGGHVTGAHLGVVGMGRIGRAIAARCHHGFGMEVSFFNRSRVDDLDFPARQVDDLRKLAAAVDILVLAVPASPETHHMIDAQVLAAMRPDAHLVNIARGDVVDETALIAALQDGTIAGAGLDVYEHEPHVPDALKAMENVVLLPHMGTSVMDVRVLMGEVILEDLRAFAKDAPLPHQL
ncbi:D-glycerate dehydrogenase [Maribius pontilimi]|uniref:D-glycerate dehydrogenase n=1 Tax=Palleronia pontilimi TaxID=1964209 RepID=A0A934IHG5_9RHOB|nr:D-glycerate dehydrogenase [Palleronia pontilimi]MBJ3762665.1 D-glycerate dehydrogenase [Palleronia pontilimi]